MRSARGPAAERPFSLADGLILIAALAAGMALVRGWDQPHWCSMMSDFRLSFFPGQAVSPARRLCHATALAVSWTIPFGLTLTAAVLALRLRSPRPSIRRIARQPGAVACAAALAAVAFRVGEESFCWVLAYLTRPQSAIHLPSPPFTRYDNPGFHPPAEQWIRSVLLETFPVLVSPAVVVAIAVSWTVLRVGGRWRPDPGWNDRAGRWLGWYWIALGFALAGLMELAKFIM